jgi:glycine/D-amino acid oxidase-like deaminating enzyme
MMVDLHRSPDVLVIEAWRSPATSERVSNLVLATGHAMMGLAMSPIPGRVVAQSLTGRATSIPLEPLSPDRFRVVRGRFRRP